MIYQIQRNISFAAITAGEYMFCYKKSSDTIYTCTTSANHINVVTTNVPVSYSVTLDFDSEDCTHDIDIYVAPICDDTKKIQISETLASPNCKSYNINRNTPLLVGDLSIKGCNTSNSTNIPHWFLSEFILTGGIDVCSSESPSSSDFNISVGPDCNCLCKTWTVQLSGSGGSLNILYTSCMGNIVFQSLSGANQLTTFCAVGEVSVVSQNGDSFTKTNNGHC